MEDILLFIWYSYPVEALKLWSLNLGLFLAFIFIMPILMQNLLDFPGAVLYFTKSWFIGGFKVHIALYFFCLIISFTKN